MPFSDGNKQQRKNRTMSNSVRTTQSRNPRRGATVVEFALTVPVLFLFVVAAIEFSRVNMIRHSVQNAAYEACRRGIVPGATAADVHSRAEDVLAAVSAHGDIIVEPATFTAGMTEVTVTVHAALDEHGWVAPLFFGETILTGSLTLTREKFETVSVP